MPRTSQALRQGDLATLAREAYSAALIDHHPLALVVLGADGHIELCNRAFEQLFGYAEADIVGRRLDELIASPGLRDESTELTRRVLQGERVDATLVRRRADGTRLDVEVHAVPFVIKGALCGVYVLYEDIGERLRAEQRFRALLEAAPDAMVLVDGRGHICHVNSQTEAMFGYLREELIGRPVDQVLPASIRLSPVEAQPDSPKAAAGSTSGPAQSHAVRRDGTEFPVEVNLSRIQGQDGALMFASVRDVTARRQLEAQLRQAQKLEAIGQLAAGVAHEINTPTQFVGDNIRFLHDAWSSLLPVFEVLDTQRSVLAASPDTASVAAQLDRAMEQADLEYLRAEVPKAIEQSLEGVDRVTRIVRAMKEFSHPGTTEKAAVDLNQLIEMTTTVARNEWKYVATLHLDLDPALPSVPCLRGELSQALLNLIVNAAHAVGARPRDNDELGAITIRTRYDEAWAEIQVVDSGCGMPQAIHARVFEPFFTTKEVGKGTGQGLAFVHNVVVRQHGGQIRFESAPNQGTTFFIQLPLHPAELEQVSV